MDEFHTVAEVRLAVPNESARHALVRSLSLRLIEDHHLQDRELYCGSPREGEGGDEEGGEEGGEDERLTQVLEGLLHIVEMLRPLPTATCAPYSSSSPSPSSSSSSSSTEAALAALCSETMSGALSSAGLRHLLPSLFDIAASGGAGNIGDTGSKLGTTLLFLACVASPSMAEQPYASYESYESYESYGDSYGGVGLWVPSAREGARSAAAAALAADEA